MSTFGINSEKHGKEDFLISLSEDYCLPALFNLRSRRSSTNPKSYITYNNILKNYPEDLREYVNNLSDSKKEDIASDLFQIYKNISDLPFGGLIHSENMATLNSKISKISFETPIKTFENKITRARAFSWEVSSGRIEFSNKDVKQLSLSIIRLNWFFNEKNIYKSNAYNSPFSDKCLSWMKSMKDISKLKNFLIGHAKKNKRIVKSSLDRVPFENLTSEDFFYLLESLSPNIENLFISLNKHQIKNLTKIYRLYRSLKLKKESWSNLPVDYLYRFEATDSILKAIKKCKRQGFTRLKHLRFLDSPFEELLQNKKNLNDFVIALAKNFKNWKI